MHIENRTHPIGWDPHSDPVYFQLQRYYRAFQEIPDRSNAEKLYDLMAGRMCSALKSPFDAIAHYIHPRCRHDAFLLFQNALWALHDFIFHAESDAAAARMWLSHFWVMLF